jgi:hypothetical protein
MPIPLEYGLHVNYDLRFAHSLAYAHGRLGKNQAKAEDSKITPGYRAVYTLHENEIAQVFYKAKFQSFQLLIIQWN